MHRFITLGSFLLLASSCSGDDADEGRTREEFCQEWAVKACSEAVVSACQATSAETCRLSQQAFCSSLVPNTFSDAASDACLNAVGDAYADADLTGDELATVLELGPPCNRVVKGPATSGESCATNRDCDGPAGYECVIKGEQTRGTCQIPEEVGAGLRCAAAQQVCASGFYCNGSNCIEAKATSEACAHDQECGPSAWCGPDGSCTDRLPINGACTDSNQCLSGLCYDFGGTDSTCVDRLRLSRSEPACESLR